MASVEEEADAVYLNFAQPPKAKRIEKRRMELCAKRTREALDGDSDSGDDDAQNPPNAPCGVADEDPPAQQTRPEESSALGWTSPGTSVTESSEEDAGRPSSPPIIASKTAEGRPLVPAGVSLDVPNPAPDSGLTHDREDASSDRPAAQTPTILRDSLSPQRPPTSPRASATPASQDSAREALGPEFTHVFHPRSECPVEELAPKGNLFLLPPEPDSLYPPKAMADQWSQEAASWEMQREPFPEPKNYSEGLFLFTHHALTAKEFNALHVISKNNHYAVCRQYLYDLGLAKDQKQLLYNLFEGRFLAGLLQATNKERDLFKYSYKRLRYPRTSAYCLTDLTPKQRQAVNFVRNYNSSPTALLWISVAKGLPTKKLLEMHLENPFRFSSAFQKEQLQYQELAHVMKRPNSYMSLPIQLLSGYRISGRDYHTFQTLQKLSHLPEAFDWIVGCARQFYLTGLTDHLAYGRGLYQKLHNEFRAFPEKHKLFPFKSKPEIHSWKLTETELKMYTSMRDLEHSPSAQVWLAVCDTLQDLHEFKSHFYTGGLLQTVCTYEQEMELNNQERHALSQLSERTGSLHETYNPRRERFIEKRAAAFANIDLAKEEMLKTIGGGSRNLCYGEEEASRGSTPDVNMESLVIYTPPPGCSSTVEALDKQRQKARMVSKSGKFLTKAPSDLTDIKKKLSYFTTD